MTTEIDELSLNLTGRRYRDLPDDGAKQDYVMGEFERLNRLKVEAPAMADLLRLILDWGRNHTSPTDPNSPHDLLVAADSIIGRLEGRAS